MTRGLEFKGLKINCIKIKYINGVKWKLTLRVLCDWQILTKLKTSFFKRVIRSVMTEKRILPNQKIKICRKNDYNRDGYVEMDV